MKAILQAALNKYIALDPEAKNRLLPLQNKVMRVELLGLGLTLQMMFKPDEILIQEESSAKPDVIIRGAPLSLLRLMKTSGDRKHFFVEEVEIQGDLDFSQDVMELFDSLEIDWEEYASRWVGDVPAYHMGQVLQKIKQFNQRVHETVMQTTNEYVHEEINLFPPAEELDDFFQDVDVLRMDVDRLTVRTEKLTKLLEGDA